MSYRENILVDLDTLDLTANSGVTFDKYSEKQLKSLWRKTLEAGMHGICFSMYEDCQESGDTITVAQVERRVKILKPYTNWIRSFSCIEGNEHIPRVANPPGYKR
jgi:hypothetical protein